MIAVSAGSIGGGMIRTVDIITAQRYTSTVIVITEVFEDVKGCAQHDDVRIVVAQPEDPERNDVTPLVLHRLRWYQGH